MTKKKFFEKEGTNFAEAVGQESGVAIYNYSDGDYGLVICNLEYSSRAADRYTAQRKESIPDIWAYLCSLYGSEEEYGFIPSNLDDPDNEIDSLKGVPGVLYHIYHYDNLGDEYGYDAEEFDFIAPEDWN